jgi:MFS transporter, PAT family, beta-lactamase induction signal transducer AmpG
MNLNIKTIEKMGLLTCLYISQSLPAAFFSQTIPVFLRQQGVSLEFIGLLSLLILPQVLRFLWAPWVDSYGRTKRGHYKLWIIGAQSVMLVLLIICSLFNLKTDFPYIIAILLVLYVAIATQDIATDALAIGLLEERERGIGNGIQIGANSLGAILGGGVLLLLLENFGWQKSVVNLAIAISLLAIPIYLHRETFTPIAPQVNKWGNIRSFLSSIANRDWLLAICIFGMSLGMTLPMTEMLLVDRGWSFTDIGMLVGVVGNTVSFVSALVAGTIVTIWGKDRSILLAQGFAMFAISLQLWLAAGVVDKWAIYAIVLSLQSAMSMVITSIYTIMMDRVRPDSAGTDFSIQVSVLTIGGIGIGGGFGGAIASKLGYSGLFTVSLMVALVGICLTYRWLNRKFQTSTT